MTRTVVVLAGGLGLRVAHLTGPDLPKALLPVGGHPFIDLKLAELIAGGAEEIVLLVGHNAHALDEHLRAAAPPGARVRCVEDGPELLGTGGAIRRALDGLPDRFWVTYGDTLLDVPMERVEEFADASDVPAVMVVLENADRWETSNVSVADGRVAAYEKGAPPGTHRFIDYGMLLLGRESFAARPPGTSFDLGEILTEEIAHGRLGAWTVSERFRDIGTEAAWRDTDAWVRERAVWDALQERIRRRGYPAIFLDRDGVLVESRRAPGGSTPPVSVDDVAILPGVADALHALRGAGYRLVVVTNQPDVARGTVTQAEADAINEAIRDALPVDAIYACFHDGPDCECRKPRPGMLHDATRELDLDLRRSWLIGDRWVDIAAGDAAGVRTVLIDRAWSWNATSSGAAPSELAPGFAVASMPDAVTQILGAPVDERAKAPE